MRKQALLATLFGSIFLLSACGNTPSGVPVDKNVAAGEVWSQNVTINGKTRECWFWSAGSGNGSYGGMSCDWSAK